MADARYILDEVPRPPLITGPVNCRCPFCMYQHQRAHLREVQMRVRPNPVTKNPTLNPTLLSRSLLLSFLTETQQHDVTTSGVFEVVGSDGKTYRIETNDYSGNIYRVEDGRRFCCYPQPTRPGQKLPLNDMLLGQFLALVTNAPYFLRIAENAD